MKANADSLKEALKLLKEARKIILASSTARYLNADWLDRSAHCLRKAEKAKAEEAQCQSNS